MGLYVEMGCRSRSVCDGHRAGELHLVGMMTVYDKRGLQELLGIGKDTAYAIMKQYGFRTGYTYKSPLRITEEGVKRWADSQMMNTDSLRTPSNG